jgi:anti-sigma B factor antagonist
MNVSTGTDSSSSETALGLVTEMQDRFVRIQVFGEIDLAVADRLRVEIVQLGEDQAKVILDLSGVSFMDSAGLGAMLGIARSLTAKRSELWISDLSPAAARIIALTGTSRLLQFEGITFCPVCSNETPQSTERCVECSAKILPAPP